MVFTRAGLGDSIQTSRISHHQTFGNGLNLEASVSRLNLGA